MTKKEAITKLKSIQKDSDTECAHANADTVLCEFLASKGYSEIVVEWDKVEKWYA